MDKTELINNLMIEDRKSIAKMSAHEFLKSERMYYKWKNRVRFMNPKPSIPNNLNVWLKGAKSIINWNTHYKLKKNSIYAIRSWGKVEVANIEGIRVEGIPYKNIYEDSIKQAKSAHNMDSNDILYRIMENIRRFETTMTFRSKTNQDLWLRISGKSALSYSIRLIHNYDPSINYNITMNNADDRKVERNTSLVPLYGRIIEYEKERKRNNHVRK